MVANKEMTFGSFLQIYCKDIMSEIKNHKNRYTAGDDLFSCDAVIEGEDGEPVKVIYTPTGKEVKVEDIWMYTYNDFATMYGEDSVQAYALYRSAYKIKTGIELYLEKLQEIEEGKCAYDNSNGQGKYEFDHLRI